MNGVLLCDVGRHRTLCTKKNLLCLLFAGPNSSIIISPTLGSLFFSDVANETGTNTNDKIICKCTTIYNVMIYICKLKHTVYIQVK